MSSCRRDKIPDNHANVDIEKETLYRRVGHPTSEPAIYGGIEATPEIIEFLKQPARLRIYPRMKVIQDEARA